MAVGAESLLAVLLRAEGTGLATTTAVRAYPAGTVLPRFAWQEVRFSLVMHAVRYTYHPDCSVVDANAITSLPLFSSPPLPSPLSLPSPLFLPAPLSLFRALPSLPPSLRPPRFPPSDTPYLLVPLSPMWYIRKRLPVLFLRRLIRSLRRMSHSAVVICLLRVGGHFPAPSLRQTPNCTLAD
jgi:hypothetical protein